MEFNKVYENVLDGLKSREDDHNEPEDRASTITDKEIEEIKSIISLVEQAIADNKDADQKVYKMFGSMNKDTMKGVVIGMNSLLKFIYEHKI